MSYFLVEIPVSQSGAPDLFRAMRTLRTAQLRQRQGGIAVRPLLAGVANDDGRLVFLIEARSIEAVHGLVSLALLPAGRIREVHYPALPSALSGPSNG